MSATAYLGNVVVMDVEGKFFHATIDGITKKSYTFDEILAGKHMLDYPGHDVACESAHMNPKLGEGKDRGRGAQIYTNDQRNHIIDVTEKLGRTHWLLPTGLAKRAMNNMAPEDMESYLPADACIAWWHYCDRRSAIGDMVRKMRPITERDERRNVKMNASREDACIRIDTLAALKYQHDETEIARSILKRAMLANAIPPDVCAEFEIKILKSGARKNEVNFKATAVMPFFVACCEADGTYRRDANDNKIGVGSVLGGILQHHAHKSGKGSKASARAKTRLRLRTREKQFRKVNGIEQTSFPAAVPAIRKHHQTMNKILVRVLRDYAE